MVWRLSIAIIIGCCVARGDEPANDTPTSDALKHWEHVAPRAEIAPEFAIDSSGGRSSKGCLTIHSDASLGRQGWWQKEIPIEGGQAYRFVVYSRARGLRIPRRSVFARVSWLDEKGKLAHLATPAVHFYAGNGPVESAAEFPSEHRADAAGWCEHSGTYQVPPSAKTARIELHLQWAPNGRVEWSDMSLTKVAAPVSRKVRLAAVHYRPKGQSIEQNREEFAPLIARAAEQKVDLLVLPETLTQSFTKLSYVQAAEPIPGPSTEYFGTLAKRHSLHLVAGLIERDGHLVFNTSVLIGPDGALIGKYRKVCLPRLEIEAGVMPGDEYPVFDTQIGRIGMMICYDGFFPEVARELSNRGAEIIAFPVAGCNPLLVAARACENHVYLVSSTYTDVSQHWTLTGVYDHEGKLLSQATEWGEIAVAEVDLARPKLWSNLGDFKAQLPRHRPLSMTDIKVSE